MVVVKSKKVSPARGKKLERGLRAVLQKLKQDNERADQLIAITDPILGPIERYRLDPTLLLRDAGMEPDPWQSDLLTSRWNRALICCSRQVGKSQIAAALALKTAMLEDDKLVLVLSRTERQSGELFKDKLLRIYRRLGKPRRATSETALTLTFTNGSRIVALPGEEGSIRSYSNVALLIIDEASRVPDALYKTIRPMLAVSGGQLVVLSTPFGKRGWFWEAWNAENERREAGLRASWKKVEIKWWQCPRLARRPKFIAREKRDLGERWFRQEYEVSFEEMVGAMFSQSDIDDAFTDAVKPVLAQSGLPPDEDLDDDDEGGMLSLVDSE